jgi:restriction endonuclease S subunit
VASFTLPLPRLTQQRAIAQSLDELASVVDALRREALELDKRAAMMRDAILRKAFAGEL